MSNHRYAQWWFQDWHGDKALHACSIGARGFWKELLCIAHEGQPHGHVTINGRQATLKQMSTSANCTLKQTKKFLSELEAAGVFSRADDGTIFNRRMVRDEEKSKKFREIGKLGGNPALKRHDNDGDNGGGNGQDNGTVNPPNNLNLHTQKQKHNTSSTSDSDARAREEAPPEGKRVFNLVFPEDRQDEPPSPRRLATTGHMLESTVKQEPYGKTRTVDQQLAILRGEKSA